MCMSGVHLSFPLLTCNHGMIFTCDRGEDAVVIGGGVGGEK